MMKVNHLNLTVHDAQAARRFLEKYFGLHAMEGTTDDARFVGLQDEYGFVLTLLQGKTDQIHYPDTFHLGFLQQGEARAREIYQQLIADGYDVKPPGHYNGTDLYVRTPFGFTIQVG